MSKKDLKEWFLYGASGHAKVILEMIQSGSGQVLFLFDDDMSIKSLNNYTVIGKFNKERAKGKLAIISVGNNRVRKEIVDRIEADYGWLADKSAILSTSATIEVGSVIMPSAIINASTTIGEHVIVNTRASIDHDCTISSFVHIAPGTTICGGVSVGEGTLIGAGSVVLPNVNIGKWAIIGAGSVVTKNIPDYVTVKGNPAR